MAVDSFLGWFVVEGHHREYGTVACEVHFRDVSGYPCRAVVAHSHYQWYASGNVAGNKACHFITFGAGKCHGFGCGGQNHQVIGSPFNLMVDQSCQRVEVNRKSSLNGVASATPMPLRLIRSIESFMRCGCKDSTYFEKIAYVCPAKFCA